MAHGGLHTHGGQVDFSRGDVRRSVLGVAAPMLVAQVLNLLYNIVDRIYIGKMPGEGTAALAGLGVCFPLITLITAFANLFGVGGAPLCAIARGRQDREGAARIMTNAAFMLVACGVALTALGLVLQRPLLYLFGASDATYAYASDYLTIYLLGTVFVMVSLGLNPYINSQGFARTGMLTVLLGAVTNIVLDPIFIYALGMGVRGAALATILSQGLSALWVVRFLTGAEAECRLQLRGFRPDFTCIGRIIALGMSSFVMSFTDSLVQAACNATLRTFGGDLYISVMTVINSVRQIAQTPVMALSDGASPAISYNYGARNVPRVRQAIRFMTQLGFGYTALIWAAVSLFPAAFIGIFNHDPALLAAAVPSLHIYFFGFVMMAFQFSGQSVFKSLGKARQAIFFSLLRKAFIVVPLTLALPHVAGLGVNGVFLAEPISNCVGGLACYLTMRRTVGPELARMEADTAAQGVRT